MPKWDAISWWATGIFVLSATLAEATQNDSFLFLMVGSYMLRPTLYALGIATRYADERQMSIQYRSGNLALTVLIVAIIIFAIKARLDGKPSDDFNVLLIVGLAGRALAGVLMVGDHRVVATRIVVAIGSLWILFAVAENGLRLTVLPEMTPGIVLIVLGLFGKRQPRTSGVISAVLALSALYLIGFRMGQGLTFYQAITGLLVSIPLAAASICFFKGSNADVVK